MKLRLVFNVLRRSLLVIRNKEMICQYNRQFFNDWVIYFKTTSGLQAGFYLIKGIFLMESQASYHKFHSSFGCQNIAPLNTLHLVPIPLL